MKEVHKVHKNLKIKATHGPIHTSIQNLSFKKNSPNIMDKFGTN
jgi:hypothetical protein